MEEKGELDHYIGVATSKECPANFTQLEVPALTWAVFQAVGPFPDTLQDVWGRIYSEWFPSSGYELAEGPEILWNENKDVTSPKFKMRSGYLSARSRTDLFTRLFFKNILQTGTL